MKKILLAAAVTAGCVINTNAQTRVTLHEEFTGENCGSCYAVNSGFWSLANTNSAKMLHIAYMADIPAYSVHNFYLETAAMETVRQPFYDVPYAPYGRFDGMEPDPTCGSPAGSNAGVPSCLLQSEIDAEAAVAAKISIYANHYFNAAHDSVYGYVKIIAGSTGMYGTNLKLRVAFTRSMTFATAPGTTPEKVFENVVRAMYPDVNGQTLTAMAPGTIKVYSYKGKITGMETLLTNYTQTDSSVVAWVQNDSAGSTTKLRDYRSVLNAGKSVYNAGALGVQQVQSTVNMSIYPNPAKEEARLRFGLAETSDVVIHVTDGAGRVVNNIAKKLGAGAQSVELPTSQLAGGLYIVQLQVDGRVMATEKLTVIK